jgi:hypothetical protein
MKRLAFALVACIPLPVLLLAAPEQYSLEERSFAANSDSPCGHRKIYVQGDRVRIEQGGRGAGETITLVRPDLNQMTTLQPPEGTYENQPLDQWVEASFGKNSFATWEFGTFLALKFGLDRDSAVAASAVKETLNDAKCLKYTIVSPHAKNPLDVTTLWVSKKTGLPLLMKNVWGDGAYTARTEWSNVLPGPQPAALFETPTGFINVTEMQDTVFAFANRTGQKLMGLDPLPHPERITRALCEGNRLLETRFTADQKGDPKKDLGRESSYNFDNMSGQVFRVERDPGEDDGSCFLAPGAFLAPRHLVPFARRIVEAAAKDACGAATSGRLAEAKGRPVKGCRPLYNIEGYGRFLAVEYELKGKDALAALVLENKDRLIFEDLPGNPDGGEESVWRVDDGGVFDPDGFEVLFVLATQDGSQIEIGYSWLGGEGASLNLIRSSGGKFVEVKNGYRYLAPM